MRMYSRSVWEEAGRKLTWLKEHCPDVLKASDETLERLEGTAMCEKNDDGGIPGTTDAVVKLLVETQGIETSAAYAWARDPVNLGHCDDYMQGGCRKTLLDYYRDTMCKEGDTLDERCAEWDEERQAEGNERMELANNLAKAKAKMEKKTLSYREVMGTDGPKTAEEHYWEIIEEIKALHGKKGADYGTDEDPLYNLRAAEEFGMPAWVGVALRMRDKMMRVQTFVKKARLENESIEDAFLDLANYAILGLALYREGKG